MTLFTTERLYVRKLVPEDAPFLLALFNAPNWLQYLGDRNIKTMEAARTYLEEVYIKGYEENGYGAWLVILNDGGAPIGLCGLFKRSYLDQPDLGYSFLPEYEGKGYAFEAASGTLTYALDSLKLTELLAIVSEGNQRSKRLLEKLGFSFKELVSPPEENRTLQLFSVGSSDQT